MHQFKMAAFQDSLFEDAAGEARGERWADGQRREPALLCAPEIDGREHRLDFCLLDKNGVADKGGEECACVGIFARPREQTAASEPVEDILKARGFQFGAY